MSEERKNKEDKKLKIIVDDILKCRKKDAKGIFGFSGGRRDEYSERV